MDAILVLGGGLREDGSVPLWVENRLERALELADGTTPILTLSAGTTYKPGPCYADGRTIFESVAGATWLKERGYPAELLFTETASYDTIGNAYFARVIHTDPACWRRLAIITSEFHMPRTESIFRWIFTAAPCAPSYDLNFESVPDVGIDAEVLEARRKKEAAGLRSIPALTERYRTLAAVHRWLYVEHQAYALKGREKRGAKLDSQLAQSY